MKFNFLKKIGKVVSGNVIYQTLILISLPYITNLYSGENYGIYASLFATGSLVAVIATLRLEMAIVPSETEQQTDRLILASVLSSIIICISLSLIGFLLLAWKDNFFISKIQIVWVCFFSFLTALVAIINQVAIRDQRFSALSISKVTGVFSLICGQILIYKICPSWIGLLGGAFLGVIVQLLTLIVDMRYKFIRLITIKSNSLKDVLTSIKLNYTYPLYNYPSAIFNSGAYQLPVILITSIYGPIIGANFSIVQKTLNGPTSLIGNAIANVIYPTLSSMINKGNQFGHLVRKANIYALVGAVVVATTSPYILPHMYTYVFGEDYILSGEIAIITITYFLIRFIANSQTTILLALKKLKSDLVLMILLLISQLAPLGLGKIFGLSFNTVIWAMTICGSILYLIMLGYINIKVKSHDDSFVTKKRIT